MLLHSTPGASTVVFTKTALHSSPAGTFQTTVRQVRGHKATLRASAMQQSSDATFSQRLRRKETLVGTLVTLADPAVTELLAATGFDWLFIDCEHAPLAAELPNILRAAHGTPCLVRVPELSESAVKAALDLGAAGIIAPQVNSESAARDLVKWAKYSPAGARGVGAARAQGYGMDMADYLARANEETVVVAQIEHADAVKNVDRIAGVPGIDALFIGPYDLSASLGIIGELEHPLVTDAVAAAVRGAAAAGVAIGAFGMSAEKLAPMRAAGATLLGVGIDTVMLAAAAQDHLAALRQA